MTSKAELRARWLVWLNGLIHATVDAVMWGGASAFGVFIGALSWREAGMIIVTAVGSGLRGYYKQSPLPDVFATSVVPVGDAVITTTTTVEGTQPTDNQAGYATVLGLVLLVVILGLVLVLLGYLSWVGFAVVAAVCALLAALLGPRRVL